MRHCVDGGVVGQGGVTAGVTCYVAQVSELPKDWGRFVCLVPRRYREKACGKAPLKARQGALVAGLMLRHVLVVTSDDDLMVGEQGKLSLAQGKPCFCLSHADGVVVLGVSAYEVGVDVERIPESYGRAQRDALRYVLSEDQLAVVDRADDPALAFVCAWTGVEAVLKADGCGLAYPVRGGHLPEGWQVCFREYGGYGISCATRGVSDICLERVDVTQLTG